MPGALRNGTARSPRGCRSPPSPIRSYFHPKAGLTGSIFLSSALSRGLTLELREGRWGGKLCITSPKEEGRLPCPLWLFQPLDPHVDSSIDQRLLAAAAARSPRGGIHAPTLPAGDRKPRNRRQMRGPGETPGLCKAEQGEERARGSARVRSGAGLPGLGDQHPGPARAGGREPPPPAPA